MFKVMLVVCALVSSALADTAYTIHTSEGEFEKSKAPCNDDTRDKLFARLTRQPVVTVGADFVQLTTADRRDEVAHVSRIGIDATGVWTFGADELTITVRRWGYGDHGPKVIDVIVTRRRAFGVCTERWQGIVLPSRTRELLRG